MKNCLKYTGYILWYIKIIWLDKILMVGHFSNHNIFISGKFVDHFLCHCTVVRDIWLLVFSLFEVSWVTLKTIIQLLSCGQWRFQRHLRFKDWNTVPLCVLWTIRLERNGRTFDVVDHPIYVTRESLLRCLFD